MPTRLWDFRAALIAAGALERLFTPLDRAISEAGYVPMAGRMGATPRDRRSRGDAGDVTLVAAPRQRNAEAEKARIKAGETAAEIWSDQPAKARQKDTDARGTVKFSKARPREDGTPQLGPKATPAGRYIAVPHFGWTEGDQRSQIAHLARSPTRRDPA
jgi:hypothetical protein